MGGGLSKTGAASGRRHFFVPKHPPIFLPFKPEERAALPLMLTRRIGSRPRRRPVARKRDLCSWAETLFVKTFSGSLTRRFNVAISNLRSLSGGERSSLSIFAALARAAAVLVARPFVPRPSRCNLVIFPRREFLSTGRRTTWRRRAHFSLELLFNKQENTCGHLTSCVTTKKLLAYSLA